MQMKIFQICVAFVIYFLSILNSSFGQDQPNVPKEQIEPLILNLNEEFKGELPINGYMYFKINIDKKIDDEDLILIAEGLTPQSEPDILVSKTIVNPQNLDADLACISQGITICSIQSNNIINNDTYYIAISCWEECKFTLQAIYLLEKELYINQEIKLVNNQTDASIIKLFNFNAPEQNDQGDEITNLLIEGTIQNPYTIKEQFNILVNLGKNNPPTSSDFNYTASSLFLGNKALILEKALGEYIPNQDYTVLIQIPSKAIINLKLVGYNQIRNISLNEMVGDIIEASESKFYILQLQNNDNNISYDKLSLHFLIQPLTGKPTIKVNPKVKPTNNNEYLWQGSQQSTSLHQEIVLTPEERNIAANNCSQYYIMISPGKEMSASYQLMVYANETQRNRLRFDFPISGQLLPGELINYRFIILGQANENMTISVQVQTDNTNPIILLLQQCPYKSAGRSCEITLENAQQREDLENNEDQNNGTFFRYSGDGKNGGTLKINFIHNGYQCLQDQLNNTGTNSSSYGCAYSVAVWNVQNENSTNKRSQYTLSANHNASHIILRESNPIHQFVQLEQYNYYQFTTPPTSDDKMKINRIKFFLTIISGEVQMLTSRSQQFPSLIEKEKLTMLGHIVYDSNKDGKLEETDFYISVYGKEASYYILTVYIERDLNIQTQYTITEDIPQEILIDSSIQIYSLFTFNIAKYAYNKQEDRDNITIWLKPIYGNFIILITNNSNDQILLSQETNIWKSQNNFIKILNNDPSYSANGNYYGKIIMYAKDKQPLPQIGKYTLGFHTSSGMKTIQTGQSYLDYLLSKEIRHLRFLVIPGVIYEITKSTSSTEQSDLTLYLSINKENKYPDEANNDGVLQGEDNQILTLDEEKTEIACKDQARNLSQSDKENFQCYFYLTIQELQQAYVSVIVRQNLDRIRLFENQPISIKYPSSAKEKRQFYFIIPPTQTHCSIQVYSQYASIGIYAIVQSQDNIPSNKQYNFPTNQAYYYQKQTVGFEAFTSLILTNKQLNEENYLHCNQSLTGCVVLLSIYVNNQYFESNNTQQDFFKQLQNLTFTINLGLNTQYLKEGLAIKDYVPNKGMNYYEIFIGSEEQTIFISLTTLDNGDPDLVVKKSNEEFPTENAYDWRSASDKNGEFLAIVKDPQSDKVKDSVQGYYIIGVYGYRACHYVLTYSTGNYSYFQVYQGQIQEITLQANSVSYVEYTHFVGRSFKILLSKDEGRVDIAVINRVSGSVKSILPSLNKGENYWSTYNQSSKDYIYISNEDQHFCFDCQYIIGIFSYTPCKFAIAVNVVGQYMQLKDNSQIHDQLNTQQSTLYHYYHGDNYFTIRIFVVAGDVDIYVKNGIKVSETEYEFKFVKPKDSQIIKENIDNYELVKDMDYPPHSIMVIAKSFAIYTLLIYNKNTIPNMRFGLPIIDKLPANMINVFQFSINFATPQSPQNISINIIYQNKEFSNYTFPQEHNPSDFQPYVDIYFNSDQITNCFQNETTINTYSCQLNIDSNGNLIIQLLNQKSSSIIYDYTIDYAMIVSNNNEMSYILPKHQVTKTSNLGSIDKFEFLVTKPSKLLIEGFECLGKVQLFTTKIYDNLQNGFYEKQIDPLPGAGHIVGTINVDEGSIYLASKVVSGSQYNQIANSSQARYSLKVTMYDRQAKVPYSHFQVGQQGIIFWRKAVNSLEIQIPPIVEDTTNKQDGMENINYMVIYRLFISQSSQAEIQFYSNCLFDQNINADSKSGIVYSQFYTTLNRSFNNHIQFSVPLDQLPKKDVLYFSAVARVVLKESTDIEPEIFTYIYNLEQAYKVYEMNVQKPESGDNTLTWILLTIGIVVLIVLGVFLLVLYRRVKSAKNKLLYEMSDVRSNTAQQKDLEISTEQGDQQIKNQSSGRKEYKEFAEEK